MNSLPLELSSLLPFLQQPSIDTLPHSFFEPLARIYSYIFVALERYKTTKFEELFLNNLPFAGEYTQNGSAEKNDADLMQAIRRLQDLSFFTGNSGHVTAKINDHSQDVFPFLLLKKGQLFWLNSITNDRLEYISFSGESHGVNSTSADFDHTLDALLERGWFRLLLKLLEELPEQRKKAYENRMYSARCFLACDYYKARQFREAVSEFEKAMLIQSNMPQLYYNLALSYARLNEHRKGIHLLNRLNRVRPNQTKTYELLGDFYFHLAEWDRSLSLYRRAFELSDNKSAIEAKIKKTEEKTGKSRSEHRKEDEKEEKFSITSCLQDLTVEAELGKFQPVIGREEEVLQMQEILACHSKKNVLILGDPGVGKSALVQEFAYRLISGAVSERFAGRPLLRVNLGGLLAGAKFRGQFEERVMQLIREAKRQNCILFLDDIHQIVAGSTNRNTATDASQFMKPALLNDEVQVIGTTTLEDFRTSVEKDSSFLRCFQIIRLEEPDHDVLLQIIRDYKIVLERYHRVVISDESLETALLWVKVLLRDRALPDKVLDVLDRAAARVSIQNGKGAVNSETILETLSEISNVPLNRMSVSERVHYRNIQDFLAHRVVGQEQAIGTVSRVLCTSKLRMNLNPSRPKGIFLFIGPTGVGKTELAKAMAQFLFGHEDRIVRIDMSEYMERYSASRLIGTSPGYVGYYDQNQLVDKIRTNPYSLILLDEIEKADPQLLSIFLQVFDAGRLTDGKGKVAYFDNTTIVMTSNVGTHLFAQNRLGYGVEAEGGHVTRSDLMKEVKKFFQPEFLNRIDEIVFFSPLSIEHVREIANMKMASIFDQLTKQGKQLSVQENAMLQLCKMGYDYEYGARNLERVLRRCILDHLAELALREDWPSIKTISAEIENGEFLLKTDSNTGIHELLSSNLEEQDFIEND
ncbi:MAG TPA: AAA family ATPase [Acidobacteriota bacterium]|nr:AAA family ATPase [Acidobacteriota bacterium]